MIYLHIDTLSRLREHTKDLSTLTRTVVRKEAKTQTVSTVNAIEKTFQAMQMNSQYYNYQTQHKKYSMSQQEDENVILI